MTATPVSTYAQPAASGSNGAASSGSTGWATISAAKRGPISPVTCSYPAATAAVTAQTAPAYPSAE
nr:hypothetical protein GCM10020092_082840 [Actinoplanes digitatis]